MTSCRGTLTLPSGQVPDGPAIRGRGTFRAVTQPLRPPGSRHGGTRRWPRRRGSGFQASVQDADEPVGDLAQGGVVLGAAGASSS